MPVLERPQLRPYLAAAEDDRDGRFIIVWDRLGVSPLPQRLTRQEFLWLQMCDGHRTPHDIHRESMRQLGNPLLPLEVVAGFLNRMDQALFLEGPRFRARVDGPVRPAVCVGSYEGNPQALRHQIRQQFTCPQGPGLPRDLRPDGNLRAALLPHIDYGRGGPSYAWGFREVVERTQAALFVIIGTSHLSPQRFTLTRKAFATPLGVTLTDQDYIHRLVRYYGDGLFEDELGAHLPEWSIELEVVFLQFLYEGRRSIRIVPLVVGSFQDCIDAGRVPSQQEDIGRMIEALRRTEAETPEPICYIISGDLATPRAQVRRRGPFQFVPGTKPMARPAAAAENGSGRRARFFPCPGR